MRNARVVSVLILLVVICGATGCGADEKKPKTLAINLPTDTPQDTVVLLRRVLPKIEARCPGLVKYWSALEFQHVEPDRPYHIGAGTHLPDWPQVTWLVFKVKDENQLVPAKYRAHGHVCSIGVDADGTALIVPKSSCQSLFFDRAVAYEDKDDIVDIRD